MKKFIILGFLITLTFMNSYSMEEDKEFKEKLIEKMKQNYQKKSTIGKEHHKDASNRNLGTLEILPNEIIYMIVKFFLADIIASWNDIFDFDKLALNNELNRIRLISKDFNVLSKQEIKILLKILKKQRFFHLTEIVREFYKKNFPEEEIVQKLIDIKTLDFPLSEEILKETFRLIMAIDYIDTEDIGWVLRIAVCSNSINLVSLLIKNYDVIDKANSEGITALMWAARHGYNKIIKLLLKKRAKMDIQDKNGMTALMLAVNYDHKKAVKLLKKNNASISLKNNQGRNALMLTYHTGIEKLLKNNTWFCSCILQ